MTRHRQNANVYGKTYTTYGTTNSGSGWLSFRGTLSTDTRVGYAVNQAPDGTFGCLLFEDLGDGSVIPLSSCLKGTRDAT
jgi:hypothetical protein